MKTQLPATPAPDNGTAELFFGTSLPIVSFLILIILLA
jgi:hypothetical protein